MYDKATQAVNAVPHRWISTCNVLEEIFRSWVAVEDHYQKYQKNEQGGIFSLDASKTEIEELYRLMKAVSVVMKDSQETGVPTGLSTFVAVVILRCITLDTTKPLDVTVPRKVAAGDPGTTNTTTVERSASSLKEVTTSTRKLLADALDKRFFTKRYHYREEMVVSQPPGFIFEMAACMNPAFHTLRWLPVLCSTEERAQKLHERIKEKVVELMVAMAEGAGDTPVEGSPENGGGGGGAPPARPAV